MRTTSDASSTETSTVLVASVIPLVGAWRVDRPFDYAVPESLWATIAVGCVVRVPFGHRKTRGIVAGLGRRESDRPLEEIASLVFDEPMAPPPVDRLLEWIAERYVTPVAAAFERAVPKRVRVDPGPVGPLGRGPAPALVTNYRNGDDLVAALREGRPGAWCLRCLPTEDRGRLIAELAAAALQEDGGVLVAVPEVRYGSRVLDELTRHWPELARVDTGIPERARAEGWVRLARGHRLGAGGRSALLAPVARLRLVIVDEEHHRTYKEDRQPRFDGRRVALERARLQDAVCVLVSPTPSLETGRRVLDGAMGYVEPAKEAARAARPIVEVVEPGEARLLSKTLHARVHDALNRGERVALVTPTRGYANAVWCSACKRSLRCERCESGMFYERGRGIVRCRACGFTMPPPKDCPACGAAAFRFVGAGSERIAEQAAAAWPRANVVQVDADALDDARTRLDGPGIYVTTWIGVKPAIRPDVRLVGVIDGDALIRKADFRGAEHAYHALMELAGWAGPAAEGGRLVVQSSEPAHHALQAVVRADYSYWMTRELAARAELGYPPFSELVKVAASGPGADRTIESAASICRDAGARVLGPITRAGRLQFLAKCPDAHAVALGLREVLASAERATRISVDVDPWEA